MGQPKAGPTRTARVNISEADLFGNHCVVAVSSFGSLIHTAVGSAGGSGGLRTKRSGCGWQRRRLGRLADEALGVLGVGGVEDLGPLGSDELGATVVHVSGRVEPDPTVTVLVVVPAKEPAAEGVGVLVAAEAVGELGPVLHGAELAFAVGVVVACVRSAVGLGHPEVGQQERHWLGGHRRAAVGVDGELAVGDALLGDGVGQQRLGERGALGVGQHPARHVARVDVEDHVQVEVGPLDRAEQLGDVPRVDLVGPGRQARRRPGRSSRLALRLLGHAVGGELLQQRRELSLDLDHLAGLVELAGQALVLLA